MSSDSEDNDSQSDFNHLNKLNPDDQENQSQSQTQQQLFKSNTEKNTINKQNPPDSKIASHPPQSIPQRTQTIISIPKKQLTLVKQNKPRLIIDHMILKDFKSYAGTQKIGPFHKNFTSIVGPNGSGKSNLIESMLFIFGFNASWMRLNKLHQLIHNSSAVSNITSAAVEVHFKKILDNNDGTITQIPDSQFFIRRTVNTSSVSKYYFNGHDSTQAEIKSKLKSEGIDLTNNRFLILQGEVEQISQMKQKSGDRDKPGFLEYLQDIIGSNQFIDRIQQAVKEYNAIQQTKHEKGQRMKISQDQLKSMQQQKQQAIKFVKKERKIFQIQSILQQVLRSNSAYELKKVHSKLQQLQKKRDQIMKQERQKMSRQAERVRQIKRLRQQGEKLDKQISRGDQKMAQLTTQDNNLKSQIAYNSEDQVKYEKKIQEFNLQFTKIIEESDSIRKGLPDKQKSLNLTRQNLQSLKKQLAKYDKPQLREKIKQIENEIKKCTLQKTTFIDKHKTLTAEVSKQTEAKHEHKITEYKTQLQQNLQMKAKIEIALQVATKQYKNTKSEYEKQTMERNKLRQQCSIMENMIKQKNSQKYQQGQINNSFNHIMKANIPGVVGRLGDLGDIPRQYDDIITTACGRLDNIVTQTYQAASKVLDFLKKNKMGRATCIILDKISQFKGYMNKPFQNPQGAVRLFDIIKPSSEQARVAFYFALSNTLYCENIDYAMKLSLGDDNNRRRVIARKGKGFTIYEMNGIINSVYARRGGFEKKAAQKKKNQQQDRQVEQRYHQLTRQIESKNVLCEQLERKLKQFESNFQTMRSQKVVFEDKIKDIRDQLTDLQRVIQKGQRNRNSIENMQKQIKAIEQEILKIQSEMQKLQKTLQKIENEQKQYETEEVTSMRQRYKTLRQQYTKMQKQVEKEEVVITTVEKRIKQNQAKKASTQKQIQRLQAMIEKCKADMDKIQKIGLELLTSIAAKKKRRQQTKQSQEQIKRSLDQDEQIVRQSRKKIQQAKQVVENTKRQIRKAQEDYKLSSMELQRIRKMYVEMTSTYDFLEEIDIIEKMNINHNPQYQGESSSILDVTLQNLSVQMTVSDHRNMSTNKKQNQARMLDMKKIQKIDPLKDLSEDDLDAFLLFQDKLRASLSFQHTELKRMQGKNLTVISQYKVKFLQYKQKLKQFTEVMQKQSELKKLINELKQQRFQMFREGFSVINSKLKEVYQLLTNGGDAELELIDSLDPFSDGVNFSVRPPKKAWKEINKLSGGEKTLSSLSLIFALHYYKPTPLYFMDEIDAALDFKNVSIVGDYIKKRTKDAQFIIISLRNNMFDLADKLVGVYKTFDQTKVINLAAGKLLAKRQAANEQNKQKSNQDQNIPKIAQV